MKIAFIVNKDKFLAKLTKFFTGCYCYHLGFYSEETDLFYDMHLTKRSSRGLPYKEENIIWVDLPVELTEHDILEDILFNNDVYGIIDYFLFSIRFLFHLVGKSTPNAKGTICSEWVWELLKSKGYQSSQEEVPSPCSLLKELAPEKYCETK